MDPAAVPPELMDAFVMEVVKRLPNAGFWLSALGVLWAAWRSASSHLCDLVKQSLTIAEAFAKNGIDVRLTVTNIDGDVVKPPRKRTPKGDSEDA
jgi:hypothetical protein